MIYNDIVRSNHAFIQAHQTEDWIVSRVPKRFLSKAGHTLSNVLIQFPF